jgi:hypothetical protein
VLIRRSLVITGCVAATLSLAGPASAKEINNTVVSIAPGVVTSDPCQVKSFKTSSVTGVGDTGLSSISADYQVAVCDSKSNPLAVDVLVFESWDPSIVMRDEPNAPLSDKFTILGVKVGTSYTITLTVRDAVTGATLATASRSAKASYPTGV